MRYNGKVIFGSKKCNDRSGQMTLSLVVLVSGIVVLIALTVGFLSMSYINTSSSVRYSNMALTAANAGIQDGYLQLVRNKDFSPLPYNMYLYYPGSCTGNCFGVRYISTTVTILQNTPLAGQVTIRASSTINFARRVVESVVAVSSSTGQVDLLSWRELTI